MGVVGQSPLAQTLQRSEGKRVKGRPLEIREFKEAQVLRGLGTSERHARDPDAPRTITQRELQECHLVFVGVESERQLRWTLRAIESRPILTIGELPAFAREGGMIGLLGTPPNMQLEVNVNALRRARIALSSRLLRLARVVPAGGHRDREAK